MYIFFVSTLERRKKQLSSNKAWTYLIIGGLFEVVWATGLKFEEIPIIVVIIAMLISFDFWIRCSKIIPIGTSYAVFTSMGTLGTLIVDFIFAQTSISIWKVLLILLLLGCVIGLKVTSEESEQ